MDTKALVTATLEGADGPVSVGLPLGRLELADRLGMSPSAAKVLSVEAGPVADALGLPGTAGSQSAWDLDIVTCAAAEARLSEGELAAVGAAVEALGKAGATLGPTELANIVRQADQIAFEPYPEGSGEHGERLGEAVLEGVAAEAERASWSPEGDWDRTLASEILDDASAAGLIDHAALVREPALSGATPTHDGIVWGSPREPGDAEWTRAVAVADVSRPSDASACERAGVAGLVAGAERAFDPDRRFAHDEVTAAAGGAWGKGDAVSGRPAWQDAVAVSLREVGFEAPEPGPYDEPGGLADEELDALAQLVDSLGDRQRMAVASWVEAKGVTATDELACAVLQADELKDLVEARAVSRLAERTDPRRLEDLREASGAGLVSGLGEALSALDPASEAGFVFEDVSEMPGTEPVESMLERHVMGRLDALREDLRSGTGAVIPLAAQETALVLRSGAIDADSAAATWLSGRAQTQAGAVDDASLPYLDAEGRDDIERALAPVLEPERAAIDEAAERAASLAAEVGIEDVVEVGVAVGTTGVRDVTLGVVPFGEVARDGTERVLGFDVSCARADELGGEVSIGPDGHGGWRALDAESCASANGVAFLVSDPDELKAALAGAARAALDEAAASHAIPARELARLSGTREAHAPRETQAQDRRGHEAGAR